MERVVYECDYCGGKCVLETDSNTEPFMCPYTACDDIQPTNWRKVQMYDTSSE